MSDPRDLEGDPNSPRDRFVGRRSANQGAGWIIAVVQLFRVEPDGSGSIASGGADGGFNGPIGGLLTRLAVPRMFKQAHADLEVLRRRLESGDDGSGPG